MVSIIVAGNKIPSLQQCCLTMHCFIGRVDRTTGREAKGAQADKQHAEGQEAAGQRVLTRTINEKNKLQDANIKQAEELKDLRAQQSDALKENRKLKGGISSMLFNLTFTRSPD